MTDVKQALELIARGTEEIIKIEDLQNFDPQLFVNALF